MTKQTTLAMIKRKNILYKRDFIYTETLQSMTWAMFRHKTRVVVVLRKKHKSVISVQPFALSLIRWQLVSVCPIGIYTKFLSSKKYLRANPVFLVGGATARYL